MTRWYIDKGPDSDVVVSSRIRLARNFRKYPFPSKMNSEQAKEITNQAKERIEAIKTGMGQDVEYLDFSEMEHLDKQTLVEKHIISQEMVNNEMDSGVILSEDESISIMINEEDHLRIQCLFAGLQLDKAWQICDKLDDIIEEKNEIAFDIKYGYITCCPTNIGTGIRTSAMLHLPALTVSGYIKRVLDACGKLGITVRGLYGENTGASGNMFQVSNQVTLGQPETEIISSVMSITHQLIDQERTLRNEIYSQNLYVFEDKIYRSLGILANARMISSEEGMKLLSDVRLGVNMGIISEVDIRTLNDVVIRIQPASLQKSYNEILTQEDRDIKRAEFIRNTLFRKYGE